MLKLVLVLVGQNFTPTTTTTKFTCHMVSEKATEMAVYTVQVIVGSKSSNRVGI
jgi:hypothetical protein